MAKDDHKQIFKAILTAAVASSSSPTVLRRGPGQAQAALLIPCATPPYVCVKVQE